MAGGAPLFWDELLLGALLPLYRFDQFSRVRLDLENKFLGVTRAGIQDPKLFMLPANSVKAKLIYSYYEHHKNDICTELCRQEVTEGGQTDKPVD